MLDQKPISELEDLKDNWYSEADKQTLETLPAFIEKLSKENHDYSSICYAVAAAAIGAAWAMDRSPNGGITGFQAGAIMWEFIKKWDGEKGPMKLLKYERMLYPQYYDTFDKIISKEIMKYLQDEAKKILSEPNSLMTTEVRNHMQSIADGNPPFGYKIEK